MLGWRRAALLVQGQIDMRILHLVLQPCLLCAQRRELLPAQELSSHQPLDAGLLMPTRTRRMSCSHLRIRVKRQMLACLR